MKLTPKQKVFADYYIELGNATEAAIRAGYSKKTAKETGYILFQDRFKSLLNLVI